MSKFIPAIPLIAVLFAVVSCQSSHSVPSQTPTTYQPARQPVNQSVRSSTSSSHKKKTSRSSSTKKKKKSSSSSSSTTNSKPKPKTSSSSSSSSSSNDVPRYKVPEVLQPKVTEGIDQSMSIE